MGKLVVTFIVIAFLAVGYEIHAQQGAAGRRVNGPRVVGVFRPGERWETPLLAVDDTLRRVTCYRVYTSGPELSCAPWGR